MKYQLPLRFQGLITPNMYAIMVDFAIKSIKEELNAKVTKVEDGAVFFERGKDSGQIPLDKLVKRISKLKKTQQIREIKDHFSKMQDNARAYQYFYKDFDYAKKLLRVLVKKRGALDFEGFIKRKDFYGTESFLVFDYKQQFAYVNRAYTADWGLSDAALFEIALDNIAHQTMTEEKFDLANSGFEVNAFIRAHFAAPYLIEPARNVYHHIGTFGSLIGIPAEDMSYVCPIEDKSFEQILPMFSNLCHIVSVNEPNGLSSNMFWHYKGKTEVIRKRDIAGQVQIYLPPRLSSLFRKRK